MCIQQFNDPECLKDVENEENTRVGDGIYPIMVILKRNLLRCLFSGRVEHVDGLRQNMRTRNTNKSEVLCRRR